MLKEIIKGIITLFIWAVCGAIAIAANIEGVVFWGAILSIVALAMATGATGMIWESGGDTDAEAFANRADDHDYRGKRKRSQRDTKAEMLLALMDDDERQAFKQALQQRMLESSARLGDDGEIDTPTLEALLNDEQQHQRR